TTLARRPCASSTTTCRSGGRCGGCCAASASPSRRSARRRTTWRPSMRQARRRRLRPQAVRRRLPHLGHRERPGRLPTLRAAAAAPEPAPPVVTARPAPKEFAPEPQLPDIYFDFDKSAIRPDAAKVLQASAEWLNGHADRTLLIEGHCDERGTEAYNLALGDRRAHATRDFLVAYGVIARRINVISSGTEQPQCSEHNEECWSLTPRATCAPQ